jgi:excisionase family DNA binding protein
MTSTITTAETAATMHATVRTVRAWCRTGQLAAHKVGGRWVIRVSSLARLLCPVSDRLRAGVAVRQLAARTLRRVASRRAARAMASEHGTHVIGHHQRARIAAANSGYALARDYLADMGLDAAFIAKYESAFGRKVAAVYRERHYAEPESGGIVVLRGRMWRCFRYADIRDLHAGAAQYARTRGLFELVA